MGKVHTEKSERQKAEEGAGGEEAAAAKTNGRASGGHGGQNGKAHGGDAEGRRGSAARANGSGGVEYAEDRREGVQKVQDPPNGEAGAKSKGVINEDGDGKVRDFILGPMILLCICHYFPTPSVRFF